MLRLVPSPVASRQKEEQEGKTLDYRSLATKGGQSAEIGRLIPPPRPAPHTRSHPRSSRGASGGVRWRSGERRLRHPDGIAVEGSRASKGSGTGEIRCPAGLATLRLGRFPHYPPSGTTTGCHMMALRAVGQPRTVTGERRSRRGGPQGSFLLAAWSVDDGIPKVAAAGASMSAHKNYRMAFTERPPPPLPAAPKPWRRRVSPKPEGRRRIGDEREGKGTRNQQSGSPSERGKENVCVPKQSTRLTHDGEAEVTETPSTGAKACNPETRGLAPPGFPPNSRNSNAIPLILPPPSRGRWDRASVPPHSGRQE